MILSKEHIAPNGFVWIQEKNSEIWHLTILNGNKKIICGYVGTTFSCTNGLGEYANICSTCKKHYDNKN